MANYTQRPANISTNTVQKKRGFFNRIAGALFPVKGDGVGEIIRKLVFLVAICAFLVTGGILIGDLMDELVFQKGVDNEIREMKGEITLDEEELKNIMQKVPEMRQDFAALYSQNSDIKGWIKLDGTVIDYPVVQTSTNEYYLDYNFKKEKSKRGSIYADYRNIFTPSDTSDNTILYGHNIWSGDMFAMLTRYYGKDYGNDPVPFYKEHPTFEYETIYGEGSKYWKVFACVLFNTEEENGEVYKYLRRREFESRDDFNNFILDIMDRSLLWTDVDLQYGDKLLTMSTCYYPMGENIDTRCVVFARQVREGEDPNVDVSKAMKNPSPLYFDYQNRVMTGGAKWPGRTWDTSKLLSYLG